MNQESIRNPAWVAVMVKQFMRGICLILSTGHHCTELLRGEGEPQSLGLTRLGKSVVSATSVALVEFVMTLL